MNEIEIGRLLRSGTAGFVVGCRVNQLDAPSFGALVRVPLWSDASEPYWVAPGLSVRQVVGGPKTP